MVVKLARLRFQLATLAILYVIDILNNVTSGIAVVSYKRRLYYGIDAFAGRKRGVLKAYFARARTERGNLPGLFLRPPTTSTFGLPAPESSGRS